MVVILKEQVMKKIFKLLLCLSIISAAVSCGNESGPDVSSQITGEWHLVQMTGVSASAMPQVYIDFRSDSSFELYQKVGDVMRYRKYTGTYTVSGTTVSGVYSDGIKWGGDKKTGVDYTVSFEGDRMSMTAQNESKEVCTYEKKALSESDKADAELVTKSVDEGPRFL